MPLFRRRRETPATRTQPRDALRSRPAPPTAVRDNEEPDWRAFGPVAEEYEEVRAPETGPVAADLVRMMGVRPGERVLDVGTGTGVAAEAAARAIGSDGLAIGLDASVPMLRVARRVRPTARYAAAEAIDLPFRDGTFDALLCTFTITTFARYDTALFDMLRVLKPGGRFGATTWGPTEDEFTRAWREVAEQFTGKELIRDAAQRAAPWADRFEDPARLKDALYEAGLRQIQVERREYRFEISREAYLRGGEITSTGRFLRQMLGDRLWETFRTRVRQAFAERFPPTFNDFREAILAVGRKP
jgi:ubiquinone/menaquinone biosynthesis C-methylase UbiE